MPRTRSQPVTSQRPRGFSFRAAASVLTFGVTVCAIAGPTFEEIPDAGSSPSSAQPASGTGPLGRIKGDLTGTADAIDFEDMYLICITDPVGFSATVDATGTNFDTQLWLFHLDGTGLLSNDNDEPSFPTVFSKITPLSTDGSGAALTTPGLYFLAISVKGSFPVSPAGPIFNDPTPNGHRSKRPGRTRRPPADPGLAAGRSGARRRVRDRPHRCEVLRAVVLDRLPARRGD